MELGRGRAAVASLRAALLRVPTATLRPTDALLRAGTRDRVSLTRLCDVIDAPMLERGVVEAEDPAITVWGPDGGPSDPVHHGVSDIGWSVLERARVKGSATAAWLDARTVADPTWRGDDASLPFGPGMHRHGDRLLRTLPASRLSVRGGRFLGGFHPHNWAHWILDLLPRLAIDAALPAHLRAQPLLVPRTALKHPRFRESLATFAQPDELIGIENGRLTRVAQLIWFDNPRPAARGNHNRLVAPSGAPVGLHERTFRRYRAAVRAAHAAGARPSPKRRIFLARDPRASVARPRRHNEAELLAVARSEGFEAVRLEALPFEEQVRSVATAGAIAGPHGAAWAMTLFAGPGTRGLVVQPATGPRWLYPTVAWIAGMDLRVLGFRPRMDDLTGARVDPERFRTALRAMLDAD